MRLHFQSALLLITIFSTLGFAALSYDVLLESSSHVNLANLPEDHPSFLPALIPRRDRPEPAPYLGPTPTPTLASKRDNEAEKKKSKDDSEDTATSEDTSTPTLSTSGPATVSATSTVIVSPTPASSASTSSSLIAATSLTLSATTTWSPAPSSTPAATSTPSKSSVSSGLIAGVVIAILLVLAALTWVISMRRHLRQREWQFKYHERIFDGPEGLLSKKQQAQQQQKEEVHEMMYPISTAGKGPATLVTEKTLPGRPDVGVSEPERVLYGTEVKRKPVGDGRYGIG